MPAFVKGQSRSARSAWIETRLRASVRRTSESRSALLLAEFYVTLHIKRGSIQPSTLAGGLIDNFGVEVVDQTLLPHFAKVVVFQMCNCASE